MKDNTSNNDNNTRYNGLKKVGWLVGGIAIAYAAMSVQNCIGDRNSNNTQQTTTKDDDCCNDSKKTKPSPVKRKTTTIDDFTTEKTKKTESKQVIIIEDNRYGNGSSSKKYNCAEPCVYQHPCDPDLFLRYSGTAGKEKGAVWTENHAGYIRQITNMRENVFEEWKALGSMDVETFYKLNGPNYHINGRPASETMSKKAIDNRLKENKKNYAPGYVPRSGFKPQRGNR